MKGIQSVSGYKRFAPGMGLKNVLVPSGFALRTSGSNPSFLYSSICLCTSMFITFGILLYS